MRHLQAWYQTELGRRVARAEHRAVSEALASLGVGDIVGAGPLRVPLALRPTVRQWHVSPADGGDLVARPEQLPFRGQSVEALILSHVLEVSEEPGACLAQAYEILRPEGWLVVLSFNPFSLWGSRRALGALWGAGVPWRGRQWPASALSRYLQRRGFQALGVYYLAYQLPVEDVRFQARMGSWEDVWRRLGRPAAGVQMTVACRREPGRLTGPDVLESATPDALGALAHSVPCHTGTGIRDGGR